MKERAAVAAKPAAPATAVRLGISRNNRAIWAAVFCVGAVLACRNQAIQPNGGAIKLAFTVQPSNVSAGAVITPPVQVAALDAQGNIDNEFSGSRVTVAIKANPGGGALAGTLSAFTVNGVATFNDLRIDNPGTGYSLAAGASGLAGATSTSFDVAWTPNSWMEEAPMATPRGYLAVGVVNNVLYALGGVTATDPLSTVEAYDPTTNSWSTTSPMPTARIGLAVGVVNGTVYAVGGFVPFVGPVGTVEAYDPITNTWTTKATMPTARDYLAVGVVSGVLYAVGGYVFPGGSQTTSNAVEAYDPISDTWTAKAPLQTARGELAVGVVNGVLYAVGGQGGVGDAVVEAYDPVTNAWTTKASLPTGRYGLGVGVANNTLYAIGGLLPGSSQTFTNKVEAYDATTNTWTTRASMPSARAGLGIGALSGIVYAVGGSQMNASGGYSTGSVTNEAYHP